MADKKFSIADKVFLSILLCGLLAISGCASQSSKSEDSNHYRAQVQPQGYPCPSCGHQIPVENISANIREKNECQNCQKIFFGVPVVKSRKKNYQSGYYGLYGPRIYGPTSVFRSNTEVEVFVVNGGGFKKTETGFVFWNLLFKDIDIDRNYVRSTWSTRFHSRR